MPIEFNDAAPVAVPDTAPTLREAIAANAAGPKRARGDEGEFEQHPLKDQIAAAEYLDAKTAAKRGLGVRLVRLVPPGSV